MEVIFPQIEQVYLVILFKCVCTINLEYTKIWEIKRFLFYNLQSLKK